MMLSPRIIRRLTALALVALLPAGWSPALAQQAAAPPPAADFAAAEVAKDGVTVRAAASEAVAPDALIEQALARNPEMRAMARQSDMMRARVPQAKALPDRTLQLANISSLITIPPLKGRSGDTSSERMVGISQELPFHGKHGPRGRVAETCGVRVGVSRLPTQGVNSRPRSKRPWPGRRSSGAARRATRTGARTFDELVSRAVAPSEPRKYVPAVLGLAARVGGGLVGTRRRRRAEPTNRHSEVEGV